jgi:hypothetical protein
MMWAGTIDMKNMVASMERREDVWSDDEGEGDGPDDAQSMPKRRARAARTARVYSEM